MSTARQTEVERGLTTGQTDHSASAAASHREMEETNGTLREVRSAHLASLLTARVASSNHPREHTSHSSSLGSTKHGPTGDPP